MIDSYITRAVTLAITSKKPDWDFFDDLMTWCMDSCLDLSAQFVLGAKMAHPDLSIKEFSLYDWGKHLRGGRSDYSLWDRGNKMEAWKFFLIAAEGMCIQPIKTLSGQIEDEREDVVIPVLDGINLIDDATNWIDIRAGGASFIGPSVYNTADDPRPSPDDDEVTLDGLFNRVPCIRAINIAKQFFIDSFHFGARREHGELYIYQDFDADDACAYLHRKGNRKDAFCEGKTRMSFNFSGTGWWTTVLLNAGVVNHNIVDRIVLEIMRVNTGEFALPIHGMSALEELAFFMLDKSYIRSMLKKLRTRTGIGRRPEDVSIPSTLYLYFLTQDELAALPIGVLEELNEQEAIERKSRYWTRRRRGARFN